MRWLACTRLLLHCRVLYRTVGDRRPELTHGGVRVAWCCSARIYLDHASLRHSILGPVFLDAEDGTPLILGVLAVHLRDAALLGLNRVRKHRRRGRIASLGDLLP